MICKYNKYISHNLKWNDHIQFVINKLRKLICIIFTMILPLYIPIDSIYKLYGNKCFKNNVCINKYILYFIFVIHLNIFKCRHFYG